MTWTSLHDKLRRLRLTKSRKSPKLDLGFSGESTPDKESLTVPFEVRKGLPATLASSTMAHTGPWCLNSQENSNNASLPKWLENLTALSNASTCIPGNMSQGSQQLSSPVDSVWLDTHENVIAGPYNHLLQSPGKGIRDQVINAFNNWMGVSVDRLEIIKDAINMLHLASLLVDDIQDNSILRRGLPAAHTIYGIAQTINSANYFHFKAMKRLEMLGSADAMSHFAEELLQLHRGQGMDLYWRDLLVCPSEDEYVQMISNKTGGLFRLIVKLMHTQSPIPVSPDCLLLADLFGLLFQTVCPTTKDDYQNLCSDEYTFGKGYCDDITEGKFSFPIIHSIHQDPANTELLNILRARPTDDGIKRYAVQCIERTGSLEYTRQTLNMLVAQGRQISDSIDGHPGMDCEMRAVLKRLVI